jgi:hypothetical protein
MVSDHELMKGTADAHDSLTWGWRPLEWIPKPVKWREWPRRKVAGFYMPRAEPRLIENELQTPIIHRSVVDRMQENPIPAREFSQKL